MYRPQTTYGNQLFYGVLGITLGLAAISTLVSTIIYFYRKKKSRKSKKEGDVPSEAQRGFAIFATFCFSVFLLSLGTFNFYPWFVGAILITVVIGIHMFVTFSDIELLCEGKKKRIRAGVTILSVLLIIIIFITCFLLSGICFGFNPNELTFVGSRLNSPDLCANYAPQPCHFYILFGQNVSSQIVVVYHSYVSYKSPVLLYSKDQVTWASVTAESRFFSLLNFFTYRYLYYSALDNLEPDTVYYLQVGDSSNSKSFSPVKKIRTGPASGAFSFAVGGDVGCEFPYPEMTSQQVAKREILFLALGGDIAYANGLAGCYQRWDKLLWMWEKTLITPNNFTVPFIMAIGNHEAGVAWGSYNKKTAPYYFNYLPFEAVNGRDPMELLSYHYHLIGDSTVLYSLDSEITLSSAEQVGWLSNLMGGIHAPIPNKLAIYHIPLFPGSRTIQTLPIPALRQNWMPVFDEYNLTIAFENHDHVFQRSHLMKYNEINENGTLYIGDGAFGVLDNLAVDTFQRLYVDKAQSIRHFMFVDVVATQINITIVSYDGTILDNVLV